jgi:hypothetical protein
MVIPAAPGVLRVAGARRPLSGGGPSGRHGLIEFAQYRYVSRPVRNIMNSPYGLPTECLGCHRRSSDFFCALSQASLDAFQQIKHTAGFSGGCGHLSGRPGSPRNLRTLPGTGQTVLRFPGRKSSHLTDRQVGRHPRLATRSSLARPMNSPSKLCSRVNSPS